MGTQLIESRKNGSKLDGLTDQQRAFVLELLADEEFCPTHAARKAGYANPSQAANKLLKHKKIMAALGKAQREREERCQLKADDVLHYLRTALFFNPLNYFSPAGDGGWLIDDLDSLPEEVGRLIEEIEVKAIELPDGSMSSKLKVKFISKATVLPLAMKHLGMLHDKTTVEGQIVHVDWDEMYKEPSSVSLDTVPAAIETNGRTKHRRNGNGKTHNG